MTSTPLSGEALSRAVRVYAVVNLHIGRVHGMTCNINQAQAWVREITTRCGPNSATRCVDLVDPDEQNTPLEGTP